MKFWVWANSENPVFSLVSLAIYFYTCLPALYFQRLPTAKLILATSVCTLCNDPKFVEECERRLLNEWEYNSRMTEADRKGMECGMERGLQQGMERGIEALILDNLEDGHSAEIILDRLMRHFSLSREAAEKYYERYACGVYAGLLPK